MEEILDDEQPTWRAQPPAPSLFEFWRRWRKAVNDRAALLALDAHARRDIGVNAADIDAAVRLSWWRWPLN
ncbi:MAG: DUF1127 domain-containing protein [Alphaproteobacteria bacterium]|nr:DUF1127 domain-containing protein [Alphaproteobacteria bacterium]